MKRKYEGSVRVAHGGSTGGTVRGKIVDFTAEGKGVLKEGGMVYFTEGGVIGDVVLAEVTKRKKNFCEAKVVEIIEPSPSRILNDCTAVSCGGCDFREYAYEAQLEWKRAFVVNALQKIGGISNPQADRIAGAERRAYYRNNVQLPVRRVDGSVRIGFFARKSDRSVSFEICRLIPPKISELIHELERRMDAWTDLIPHEMSLADGSPEYDGILKHIGVRISPAEETVLILVLKKRLSEAERTPIASLWEDEAFLRRYGIISVYENINPGDAQTYGGEWNLLYGAAEWEEMLSGKRFRLVPASFFQVHRDQAEVLYRIAVEYAFEDLYDVGDSLCSDGLNDSFDSDSHPNSCNSNSDSGFAFDSDKKSLLDLYCGVGSVGICASDRAKEIVGIEVVEEAVANARKNAERNGVEHFRFYAGECENLLEGVLKDFSPDVVILDPPRSGAKPEALAALAKKSPPRIVYISCNPTTLARDVKFLSASGYTLKKFSVADLFPYTTSVEVVVLMSKEE